MLVSGCIIDNSFQRRFKFRDAGFQSVNIISLLLDRNLVELGRVILDIFPSFSPKEKDGGLSRRLLLSAATTTASVCGRAIDRFTAFAV
jgi:hypothetical protein